MRWEHLAASTAAAAMIAACAAPWWIPPADAPAAGPSAVVRLPAAAGLAMPGPVDWGEIVQIADNPFVPWRDRERQAAAEARGRMPPPHPGPDPGPHPAAPPLTLPRAGSGGGDAPVARGFNSADGAVLADIPGTGRRRLRPGQAAGGWTFLGIEAGNLALFADRDGRRHAIVIGSR